MESIVCDWPAQLDTQEGTAKPQEFEGFCPDESISSSLKPYQ